MGYSFKCTECKHEFEYPLKTSHCPKCQKRTAVELFKPYSLATTTKLVFVKSKHFVPIYKNGKIMHFRRMRGRYKKVVTRHSTNGIFKGLDV